MTVPCCYKVLVFMLVAILLLIDFTNFAKADNFEDKDYNYDRYQYPDYQSSMYIFFIMLVRLIYNLTNIPETNNLFMTSKPPKYSNSNSLKSFVMIFFA